MQNQLKENIISLQYDLFQDSEIEALKIENAELKSAFGKLRRHYFAERNEIRNEIAQIRGMVTDWQQLKDSKKADLVPFFGELIEMTN